MREIKFRAKGLVKKEWLYGSLALYSDNKYVILPNKDWVDGDEVDENTIGQFTGLTDKNGKEIYEGDIVTFTKEIINGVIFQEKGFVKYRPDYAMFVLQTDTGDEILSYCTRHIEVIGNVFDNSNLLEE